MLATAKIVSCQIGPYPTGPGFCRKNPEVRVVFDNGESKVLFDFFCDELAFSEKEFIGLTKEEAFQLKFERDQAYLRS